MKKKLIFLTLILQVFISANAQFCNKYADKAVSQYKLAKKNKLPDLIWPVWSDDWNGHLNWCKSVSHDVANKEEAKRQAFLDKYIKNTKPQTKENFCNKYADKAVSDYQLAIKTNLPNIILPLWSNNWKGHYNWCITVPEDLANKETAKRNMYIYKYLLQDDFKKEPQSKEDFCNAYADKAIKQYNQAIQLHLPNMIPTQWNNNRDLHVKWCMAVPKNTASLENSKRQQLIDNFISSSQGKAKQDPKKGTKYKYIKVIDPIVIDPVQFLKIKEKTCDNFAKQAVQQLKLNMSKRCRLKNSFWHLNYFINVDSVKINKKNNYDQHKKWCMTGDHYLEASKFLKEREKQLQACRGIHTIWVPGMVIGLRHSGTKDRFFPSTQYFLFDWRTRYESDWRASYWKLDDCEIIDFIKENYGIYHWRWYVVLDGDYPKAYQYNLPPGIIVNLRSTLELYNYRFLVEFGIDKDLAGDYYGADYGSFCGPEYYGEGKFHREFGGDLPAPAGEGLSWYESTGLGFTDWSQVNNLPRGTIVGLKHSSNQPNKKLIWQGHVYDPADPNIQPPPGFIRKEGGDMGAPAGVGYFWYEKITGK